MKFLVMLGWTLLYAFIVVVVVACLRQILIVGGVVSYLGPHDGLPFRFRAIDPFGEVTLFTHHPEPCLIPDGDGGFAEDWDFDGWMKGTGEMVLPLDWQSSVVEL